MKLKLILSAFLLVASLGAFAQEESKKTSRKNVKSKEKTETTDEKKILKSITYLAPILL